MTKNNLFDFNNHKRRKVDSCSLDCDLSSQSIPSFSSFTEFASATKVSTSIQSSSTSNPSNSTPNPALIPNPTPNPAPIPNPTSRVPWSGSRPPRVPRRKGLIDPFSTKFESRQVLIAR
ncbi:hypothetical protein GIB67_027382 [Kingdonia uniflora]|uniref:Uncharacterized protein n=1 Tax=Kingdonia uniflora TaxID=39325 RepID=A0A7J7MF29_9MAGN|nr:hypothetical protein GIB67_027382 [Kingdonia uniflora]